MSPLPVADVRWTWSAQDVVTILHLFHSAWMLDVKILKKVSTFSTSLFVHVARPALDAVRPLQFNS